MQSFSRAMRGSQLTPKPPAIMVQNSHTLAFEVTLDVSLLINSDNQLVDHVLHFAR